MGNYYTRIVRVYEKNPSTKVDINRLLAEIKDTALFEYELIWNKSNQNNYFDLKWNTKRAGGEMSLDLNHFDIWELRGHDSNQLFFNKELLASEEVNDTILFEFDEIHLENENPILNNEYFTSLIRHHMISYKNGVRKFQINGFYTSSCDYEIGETEEYKQLTKQVDLGEFLEPRGESICISRVITKYQVTKELNKFLNFVCGHNEPEMLELNQGFKSIKFLYRNRIVNEIVLTENSYDMWIGRNSDWWDNCRDRRFLEYSLNEKRNDNNR